MREMDGKLTRNWGRLGLSLFQGLIVQAVILAAGMGKRLKSLTADNTKCMVRVNGVTLIERALGQLDSLGLDRIVIVTGYEGAKLTSYIMGLGITTPIEFVDNPVYDKTNNIYSLMLAKDYLASDDTLLLESDLIFEDSLLTALLTDPRPNLALVDKYEAWMDGSCMILRSNDTIKSFISGRDFAFSKAGRYWKTVNIYKFSQDFSAHYYLPLLETYMKTQGNNEYYEQVLRVLAVLDNSQIQAKRLTGQRWYEIDDIQDLDIASTLFPTSPADQVDLVTSRYGGYWRYPHMLDFCYLVNPHFPPRRMIEEITASLDPLIRSYPSGLAVNRLLAGRQFGISKDLITVGNGAAELICALMGEMRDQRLGLVAPSFEEYVNRHRENCVLFIPSNPDFSYTAEDLIEFFSAHPVDALVLVNPDNPSGNFIGHVDLLRLIEWTKSAGIQFIVDESFVDFADGPSATLLTETTLVANPHLVVVKSISKSYGIPGLRLGVLATADARVIERISSDLAIWNINSLAEFYLQISGKYMSSYSQGLELFRTERADFVTALSGVPNLRVIPTQANYVMVEILGGITAAEMTQWLLSTREILIKDLTAKISTYANPNRDQSEPVHSGVYGDNRRDSASSRGIIPPDLHHAEVRNAEYVRLAVRDARDNTELVAALRDFMSISAR